MEDLTGRTIGGYQIVEKIGRGGMATVFRAYQPSLDRDVAIKVLPPYYAEQDETFLQRFKREARAIAKLRHPNILMVMDYGEEGDIAYLVMEYVTAGTLKARMKRPIKLNQIYHLVGQVGSALQYAHDQGVVHRDIKPSNIMMPKPDWALLTDFGLATMVGGSFLTQSGMTVGTPAYMSPEQGSGERVDHRTDIYSLGIMLYEMVVGEVPYTAETPMAVVVKHIVDPLPIPREKNPEIPEDLQRVILKSLAKNPDDRYQQAADFSEALQAVANAHPDWSATEIRTVTTVRTPHKDDAETRRFEEDDLPDGEEDQPLAVPSGDTPIAETRADDAMEVEPVVQESDHKSPPPPILPADQHTIAEAGEASHRPAPIKKKQRWPLVVGGIVLTVFCLLAGLAVLNGLGNRSSELNLTDEAQNQPNVKATLSGMEEFEQAADMLRRGEFERARTTLMDVLRRNPELWGPFLGLVGEQVDAGETERAVWLLETGLEANPDAPPDTYNGLGWLSLEIGKPEKALEAFQSALQRDPGFLDAHEGLLLAARETGQIGNAIGFMMGLKERFPDQPLIYHSLAELHRADGNQDAAVEAILVALEMDPDNTRVLVTAHQIFKEIGEKDLALDLISQAVEIAPDDPAVLGPAGWAFLDNDQPERAVEVFEKAYSMDEKNGWFTLGLARALITLDAEPRRIPGLLRTAEQYGKDLQDAWLLTVLAFTFREIDDCENAIRLYNLVDELDPGNPDAKEGINSCP